MTSSGTYTVEAVRSGDWWAIAVLELGGVFSQARRLDQVETRAREAIALMLDVDEAEVGQLTVTVTPPDTAADLLRELAASEAAAAAATEHTTALRRQVARELRDEGFPLRDVGRLIGISHQRVSQILSHR
jgi:predicted RNase H-like HicB family nuclease